MHKTKFRSFGFTQFLILSLVLHIFGGLSLIQLPKIFVNNIHHQNRVEVTLMEDTVIKQKPDIEREKVDKNLPVVEQTLREFKEPPPKDANYLSRQNQDVLKETAAKNHGAFKNQTESLKTAQTKTQGSENKSNPATANTKKQDHFGELKLNPQTDWTKKAVEATNISQEEQDSSSTRDYLKNIDPGLETLLKTREFIYYSYYSRIRNQISQYWEPAIKHKVIHLFRQGRTIASSSDRVTKVLIILDKTGKLMGVQIIGQSGIQDLDETAVDAFRAAAPFPNPPDGIIEKDGTIKIRWDFILEA